MSRAQIYVPILCVGLVASVPIVITPAAAAIACKGGYQIVHGYELSTPYCEDENLAGVARQYGMKVSGSEIRSNPGVKSNACRLVGKDIRVSQACMQENSSRRGRF
jgi:hypothetical protein